MCRQCESNPVYEFTNKRKVCKNCFINYFNKKIFYTIRKFHMADNSSVIFAKNSGNFRDIVLRDCLKMFSEKSGAELISKKTKKSTIAVSDSADIVAEKIIFSLLNGKLEKFNKARSSKRKIISPLFFMLDKEILLYAKIKNLKFKQVSAPKSKFLFFIESMKKKHPELSNSVIRGYLKLFNKNDIFFV